jgi:hypothetical protein
MVEAKSGQLHPELPDRSLVGRMPVTEEIDGRASGIDRPGSKDRAEQFPDAVLNRLRIRPSQGLLPFDPTGLLRLGHGSLPAQGAVGEVVEEPGLVPDGQIGVEGEVLRILEGLEAVEDDRFVGNEVRNELSLKEKAVPSPSTDVARHGGMGQVQVSSDLAQARSGHGEVDDAEEVFGPVEPVGRLKGSPGESSPTVETAEPLERTRPGCGEVEPLAPDAPFGLRVVEAAALVRTVGRTETSPARALTVWALGSRAREGPMENPSDERMVNPSSDDRAGPACPADRWIESPPWLAVSSVRHPS